jgi:UDP-N-acetyl-D-mannosaminuronic acid dehydrogenase
MTFNHICVVGLGYIGLPTACTFAQHGVKVTGVDKNPEVIKSLRSGKVHIFEPGLQLLAEDAIKRNLLSINDVPVEADACIIAGRTPFKDGKKADMRYVIAAAEAIVPVLRKGNLVILESTSPPLTTKNIVLPILEKSNLKVGVDFRLAYSPERVLPGQILRELVENARVIGGIDEESAKAGKELYGMFVKGEIILTDSTTSEMVKLMENTYRDVNIAIANEFARLADRFGVDVWEAIEIANLHPRVKILNPGPGVGGHCISVDPWFFVEAAPDIAKLIYSARRVNDDQPDFVVELLKKNIENLADKNITVLGLAYKPDVDDLRESPAVEISLKLIQENCNLTIYEPYRPEFTLEGAKTANSMEDAIYEADVLLLLVGHDQLKKLDPNIIKSKTKAKIIFDTVNVLTKSDWEENGFIIYRLGDKKEKVLSS